MSYLRILRLSGRLFAALLCLLCLLTLAACGSDDETPTGSLAYTLSSKKEYYTVKGIGTYTGKDVVIPDEHEGLPVKYIGSKAFADTDITSVTLPLHLVAINQEAFAGCENLTTVKLADPTTSKITRIDVNAFKDTPFISSEDGDWENGLLYLGNCVVAVDPDITGEVIFREGTFTLAHQLFRGTAITKVTFPEKLYHCGAYTFSGCTSLQEVVFLGTVSYLGDGLFHDCSALTAFEIPDKCKTLGRNLFSGCSSLADITCKSTRLTTLYKGAFADCTSLKTIALPNTVTTITEEAFRGCTSLTSVSGAASLTTVGNKAFFGCSALKSCTLPTENVSYGLLVFYGSPLNQ